MTILALETSSRAASCALMRDGVLIGDFYVNAGLTHSQTVMPMVQAMLDCSQNRLDEVDVFAVSTGPGSFTGLRIGVSAVKGMALALDKPCAAVSTLYGLAVNVKGFAGIVAAVLDARCGQVYGALFRSGPDSLRQIEKDSALTITALGERLAREEGPKLLVGDGAILCKEALPHIPELYVAGAGQMYQRASSICEAATELVGSGKLVDAGELTPAYLRLPQAQRELNKRKETEERLIISEEAR